MTDTTLNTGAGASPASGTDMTPDQAQTRFNELKRDSGWKARYAAGDSAARREFASLNTAIAAGMGEHPDEYALAVSQGRAAGPQHHQPATSAPAAVTPSAGGAMTAAQAQARFEEIKANKEYLARYAAGDADARREVKQINEAIARGMDAEDGADQLAESSGPVDPSVYKMPRLSDDINKPGEMARVAEVDKFLRTTLSSLSVPKESGDQLLAAGERFGTTWNAADAAGRDRINISEKAVMQRTWGDSFDANISVVRETIEGANRVNPGIKQILWDTGLLNSSMVVSMILAHGQRLRGTRA